MATTEASSVLDGERQSPVRESLDHPSEKPPLQFRDRIKDLRRVKARDLLPNPKNWRRHPKVQIDALRALLAELGFADAVLARELPDKRLMLIDGHLRKENVPPDALVPVLILDVSEEEADKILATLDPLAAMAEADSERIEALLATVQTDSEALQALLKRTAGDRLWEILHPHEIKEVEVAPERADELRLKWDTKAGQVWQAGPHRIGCGDSTSAAVIARLWGRSESKCRLVWTDPPYGVDYASKNAYLNRTDRGNRIQRPIENDRLTPEQTGQLFKAALDVAIPLCEPGAACYATVPSGPLLVHFIHAFDASGFEFRHLLVWIKHQFVIGMADYHYRHEPILYGWLPSGAHYFRDNRSQDSVFEVDKPQVNDLHPTTKPVELISRMVANSSRPGELIYDPFAGSGSTILAAHQLGRISYGCEIDAGYVAVTLERLSLLGLKPERVDR
jgi:DNA modification methylase